MGDNPSNYPYSPIVVATSQTPQAMKIFKVMGKPMHILGQRRVRQTPGRTVLCGKPPPPPQVQTIPQQNPHLLHVDFAGNCAANSLQISPLYA